MSVEKVSFRGVEAPQPQPQPQEQTKVSFQGQEVDEEKSNAAKYMIGAAALAGVVALGIAGYKGHLGEGIQKFLGGAKKAAKDAGKAAEKDGSNVVSDSTKAEKQIETEVKQITSNEMPKPKQEKSSDAEIIKNAEVSKKEVEKPISNEVNNDSIVEIVEESHIQPAKPEIKTDEHVKIENHAEDYLKNEETENFRQRLEIARSNDRNEQWLKEQHQIKEKEYSDFWNKDVIKADDITHEVFIQTIKNIENGKTVRIMTKDGIIKSYTGLEDGSILFERGNRKGEIVEQYKMIFTDKEKNIAKFIKQDKDGKEEIEFVKFTERRIVNMSAKEERAISEYASRIRHGLNSKTFNAHGKRLLLEYGFVEVDKTVKIGDETVHIVMEGLEHDVTAEGKLLKKVFAKNGQVSYKDVTAERISEANERYVQEEARKAARRQRQQKQQRQRLFA